eukprot:GCRY01006398.1.p1 GENE.GCRY01006398.1~~GCRY01006398.1.p1  ORF type:complete len:184 (-),score=15.67 GCRY01006398.1:510-1061(-)
MKWSKCVVCLLLLLVFTLFISTQSLEFIYDPTVTEYNPYRGFFPFGGTDLIENGIPSSLEFASIPLNAVIQSENYYNWEVVEKALNKAKASFRHLVLRFYLDSPNCCPSGTYVSGIPWYLFEKTPPLPTYSYTEYGGGWSPDYTDERLISLIEDFFSRFGQLYDGDPRLGFLQVGLIGFWGEW